MLATRLGAACHHPRCQAGGARRLRRFFVRGSQKNCFPHVVRASKRPEGRAPEGGGQMRPALVARVGPPNQGLHSRTDFVSWPRSSKGRERSSVGRASPCQGERRGFKSLRSLHFSPPPFVLRVLFDLLETECFQGGTGRQMRAGLTANPFH